MEKNNGYYYNVGTLHDKAYLVAKTFLASYNTADLVKGAKKHCSTDPGARWGYFMECMLTDFDNVLDIVDCEGCWIEPEAYDSENVMDLVPIYTKELCDPDIYKMFHPEILRMFHDDLEEKIVFAALEGHYDYLYDIDEGRNAFQWYNGYNASH